MKKQLFLLAAILAMASSTPAWANNFSAVAPSGQTLYYKIVNGTAHVTYQSNLYPRYESLNGALTIPSSVTYNGTTYSVTSIDDDAFYGCSGLTSVTIPNSVTNIGSYSFWRCSGLTSITFGSSVTRFGHSVFFDCVGLTSVNYSGTIAQWCSITFLDPESNPTYHSHSLNINGSPLPNDLVIPNSVTSIGNSSFSRCSGLTSVTIGNSVTSIGNSSFGYCSSLTSVTIGNSVTSIGNWAFEDCYNLTSVNYTGTIEQWCNITFATIGSNPTFYSYSLNINGSPLPNDLVIPSSVTSIRAFTFIGCSCLTSVTIPNSVTNIGEKAFFDCYGLTTITIGNSVTSIGDRAFAGCYNLREFVSKAVYPPTAESNSFPDFLYYHILTVPCGSLAYYSDAEPWNTKFSTILEDCNPDGIDDTEIGDVMVYAANGMIYISSTLPTETTIFDIMGHQVATFTAEAASIPLPAGVYLVKIGAYPARKVVVIR